MIKLRAERYRSGHNGPASKAGWGLNSPTWVRIPPSPPPDPTPETLVSQNIRIVANLEELSRAAAEELSRRAAEAVREQGTAAIALCGGSTPTRLYALLADVRDSFRDRMPWGATRFYWGDERHVPPDHSDSNYRMAREAMLAHVAVPPGNVNRIPAENPDAFAAAEEYERI